MRFEKFSKKIIFSSLILGFCWLALQGNTIDASFTTQKQDEFTNYNEKINKNYPLRAINERQLIQNISHIWNGTKSFNNYIECDVNQNYYVVNQFSNLSQGNDDINITKFDKFHNLLWNVTWGTNEANQINGLYINSNGSLLYVIETHYNSTFDGLVLLLHSFNSTSGEYISGFDFQSHKVDLIYDGILTVDDNYLYLVGSTADNYFIETNMSIWKLDLFQQKTAWNFTWGSSESNELLKTIDLTTDQEFIYTVGLQDNYIVMMQLDQTGVLYNYNISYLNSNIVPVEIILDESESYFHLFGTKTTAGQDIVYLNCDLSGKILNSTTFDGFTATNETCLKVNQNAWNQSFYLLGYQVSTSSVQTFIAEIRGDATINWWNTTSYYGGSITYEIASDFIITESNNQLLTTGYFYGITNYLEVVVYNLTRPPAAPVITTTDRPNYDGTLDFSWNAEARAHNYSIYRSNSYFTDITTATLIEITTNTYKSDVVVSENEYYYRIIASGEFGNSTPSNCLEMQFTQTNTTYLEPIQLSDLDTNTVHLSWTDIPGLTTYYVIRNDSLLFEVNDSILVAKTEETYYYEIVPSGVWYYGIVCEYLNGTLMNSTISNIQEIHIPDLLENPILTFTESKPAYIDNVSLTWTAVPYASEYWLYRTLNPFFEFDHFSPIIKTTNLQFLDDPIDDHEYFWTIRAVNSSGSSPYNNNINTLIYSPIEIPMVLPKSANVTDRTVRFNWTASTRAQIYYIFKSSNNITTIEGMIPYANTSASTQNFVEYNQTLGNIYYVIIAGKSGLNSSMSNCINISIQDLPRQVQNVKTRNAIDIENNPGHNRVIDRYANLSWDPVFGAQYYEIYRYINSTSNPISQIGTTDQPEFLDWALLDTHKYFYGIIAVNFTGKGEISEKINFTCIYRPENATIMSISQFDRKVTLNWVPGNIFNSTFNAYYLWKYNLPINETNGHLFDINLGPNYPIWGSTSYNTTNTTISVDPGVWYFVIRIERKYKLDVSINAIDYSNISNCMAIKVEATPFAPILYETTSPNYNRSVTLNWSAALLATSYLVYRSNQPINIANINTLEFIANVSTTGYIDTTMTGGFITYYAIVATNQTGNSTPSNFIAVDVRNIPNAPIWISPLNSIFVNQINLTWQDSNNYKNYSIYRTNSSIWNSTTSLLLKKDLNLTNYIDSPFVEQDYWYWIFAHNASGSSFVSTPLELTCWLMRAPILTLVPNAPVTNHTIQLGWNSIPHVDQYLLYRATISEFQIEDLTPYQTFNSDSRSYRETDVLLGKYYFILIGSCTYGISNQSTKVVVRVEDLPTAPVIKNATRGNADAITITWDLVPNADGYIAYMSTTPITVNSSVNSMVSSPLLGASAINFTFYKAGIGNHWFIVVAANATGRSVFSNIFQFDNTRESEQSIGVTILILIGSIGISSVIGFTAWKYWQEHRNDPDRIMRKLT